MKCSWVVCRTRGPPAVHLIFSNFGEKKKLFSHSYALGATETAAPFQYNPPLRWQKNPLPPV